MTRGASERPVRGCVCVSVCVRELLKTRPCCTQPAIRHAHHSHGSCPSPPAVSGLADELSSLRPVRRPPGTLRRRIRRRRFRLRCRRRLRLRLHDSRRFRRLELWPAHRLGRGRRLSLRLDRLWLNRGMLRGMLELGVTCLRRYAAIPCRQRPVRAQSQPEQTTLCRRRCRVQDDSHGRTQDALWEREREIESERAKCLPFRKHSGVAVMQRGRERARAWGRERECEETARAKVQALYDGRTSSVDDDELSRSLVPGDPGGSGSLLLAHGSNGSNGSEPTARD